MSDFGMFEADEATQDQPRLAARTAAMKLEAAIDTVRNEFGRFLMGATGIDEFEDRWHLSKADIRKAVEPFVFPNTGTMRRVQNAMKADWKLAHPYKLAEDRDAPIQDLDETYHPSSGNLIPSGDFEGYKDSVDQNGPEKVQRDFTPGGDSGTNRAARRVEAGDWPPRKWEDEEKYGTCNVCGYEGGRHSEDCRAQPGGSKESSLRHEAAALVADIYTDFAQANGLRVASLDTLAAYADTGIAEADYRLLESMIIRAAEEAEESEEEPEEDGEDDHEEPDADNEGGPSDGDEDNEDDEESESDSDDDGDEDYDFGGGEDEDGNEGGESAGGEQFTVPEQAPQLPPQMMQEIPQDDAGGTAPVPPEVIDSLLGLPEGTIEQLLLEEAQNGQSGAPEGGDDFGGETPQGGGDDFFGEGGGDNTEPPRVAAREFWAAPDESEEELTERQKREQKDSLNTQHQRWLKEKAARRFWAADDDQPGDDSGGGEQEPPADPSAGGDPAAMGGAPMMPPPGSQSVAPPQPAMPLENQPAEDALLDTANQAIMQMIDRETAEYQQIIGPLSQALQAVQFAQQVEQSEHPMDVTPPQGSVNVDPSQAPGGAGNPQQQLARLVRKAKKEQTLKNAAQLIGKTYGINSKMLVEAMGRRQYEHVAEAFHILPPQARQTREVRAAWDHIGNMFAADNSMFNKDVWMRSLNNPGSRLPFDRPRLAGETWKNTPTMDRFEFPRAGETPEISDNMTINDLPQHQFKGLPKPKKNSRKQAADLGSKVQRWLKRQTDTGLNMGGDAMADRYLNEHSHPTSQRGIDEVHEALGATPHAIPTEPPNPSVRVPKATNPTLRKSKFINDEYGGYHTRDDDDPEHVFTNPRNGEKYMIQHEDGTLLKPGHPLTGIHGDQYHLKGISKYPEGPSGGKIHVDDGDGSREFYPSVFDAEIVPYTGGWNPDDDQDPFDPRLIGAGRTATWGEWEPTKEASFFTRRVPGWRWDDHLNGYISKEGKAFTCSCGQKVAAPSYKTCDCGKIWNVYAIGDQHHLGSNTADMFIAREIPVRPGVVMANRKMAGGFSCPECGKKTDDDGYCAHCDWLHEPIKDMCPSCGAHIPEERGFCGTCGDATAPYEGDDCPECGEYSPDGHCKNCDWNPDDKQDPFDPRLLGANRKMAADNSGAPFNPGFGDDMSYFPTNTPGAGGIGADRVNKGGQFNEGIKIDTSQVTTSEPSPVNTATNKDVVDGFGQPAGLGVGNSEPSGLVGGGGQFGDASTNQNKTPDTFNGTPSFKPVAGRLGDKVRQYLADWTKYDGEDPVAKTYGKPKPPSTKVNQPPKDWAKRLPAGDPSKKGGTWTQPPIAPKNTPKQ